MTWGEIDLGSLVSFLGGAAPLAAVILVELRAFRRAAERIADVLDRVAVVRLVETPPDDGPRELRGNGRTRHG